MIKILSKNPAPKPIRRFESSTRRQQEKLFTKWRVFVVAVCQSVKLILVLICAISSSRKRGGKKGLHKREDEEVWSEVRKIVSPNIERSFLQVQVDTNGFVSTEMAKKECKFC